MDTETKEVVNGPKLWLGAEYWTSDNTGVEPIIYEGMESNGAYVFRTKDGSHRYMGMREVCDIYSGKIPAYIARKRLLGVWLVELEDRKKVVQDEINQINREVLFPDMEIFK